ncbi:hypothetical protein ACFO0N_10640 [Halobium salinum]|uniref:Uncharacterized protein n=1 Tax=Halobium salinum TaxID=1364940 RepID=A0ABD5PBZ9_9EURY|nr:hypothetical protein [Halobium salinum]
MSQCIACGTTYSFTNTYKGNYCLTCQRTWLDTHPMTRGRPRSVGAGYRRSRRWGRADDSPSKPPSDEHGTLDVPSVDAPTVDLPAVGAPDEDTEDDPVVA